MSFGKGDQPVPPDPIATAGAQGATNVSTAIANAMLNNTNQTTPLGSLKYNVTDTFKWVDPVTKNTYEIPRFTAEQTLSPEQLRIQQQGQAAQFNLSKLAADQSGRLGGLLGKPFDLSGAPEAGRLGQIGDVQTQIDPRTGRPLFTFGNAGQQQGSFGAAGPITSTYGPADSFSADRGRVEQALYGRLNPQLGKSNSASSSSWRTRASVTAPRLMPQRWRITTGRPTTRVWR